MELTGLKSFKNAGGSVYSSIGSSDNSKTVGYKLINNLPKFANGLADDFGGWGNLLFNNSVTTPETTSTGSTSMPSVTNISSGPSLTTAPSFIQSSSSPSFNTSLSTIKSSLTSPNGSLLLDQNGFGGSNYKQPTFTPTIDWSSGSLRAAAVGLVGALANSIGSGNPVDLNKSNLVLLNSIGSRATGGKGVNWSGIGNVVTSGVQFAGDAVNSFSVNETGEEVAQKYGTSQLNVGGIGYESQNMIDLNKEMDRVKSENTGNTLKTVGSGAALGAAAGSIIPGLGTIAGGLIGAGVGLITGIFGGEARKREYRRLLAKQNSKINALQDSARFSAQTKAIQQMNAREYGDSESLYLYGAANGKQPEVNPNTGMTKDDFLLATPNGYKIGKANSLVEPGETLFDTKTGSMMQVPRQIGSKLHPGDILPAEIPEYAAVFTDRHEDPNTGKSFALAAIDGDDDPYNLLYRQKVLVNDKKNNKGLMKAKNGRLPKFDNGWLGNAITSGIGALGGLSLWLEAKNSTPKRNNSYRANPYEQEALTTLASLDINPYPITTQLRNAEARSNKAIDMSGGLSTGQRTLSRLAALHNTQLNIANTLASLLNQRNQYKSTYATAALNAGQADRQAQMAAYQWDEDMYAKAHAARQQGMQMGTWNMLNLLQLYWANEFKRLLFNETMDLYKQDQKLRADEIQALLKGNSSLAKNMYDYTKKRMGDYMIGKAATNPMFNPTKATTYKNLTGKWLAGYNFNQKPSIPYIKTR